MASKVTKNVVGGDILIIRELAKHLKYSQDERKFMTRLAKKGAIAVETLLEEAISKVGKLQRCIKDGQDFKDKSDAKKAIVHSHNCGKYVTRRGLISNVCKKNGKLRVMIADNFTDELFYFVIPRNECIGRGTIEIIFNQRGGEPESFKSKESFNWRIWNKYRVKSFKELCE
jgi:hypothetical protein